MKQRIDTQIRAHISLVKTVNRLFPYQKSMVQKTRELNELLEKLIGNK